MNLNALKHLPNGKQIRYRQSKRASGCREEEAKNPLRDQNTGKFNYKS